MRHKTTWLCRTTTLYVPHVIKRGSKGPPPSLNQTGLGKPLNCPKGNITMIKQIQTTVATEIQKCTGAVVEVNIQATEIHIYSEDMEKMGIVKNFFSQVKPFKSEKFYDADEDGPAAFNLVFSQ